MFLIAWEGDPVAHLQTTTYTADDLRQLAEYLGKSRDTLEAVADAMNARKLGELDVYYAKEFMRAIHKVNRFTGSAEEAFINAIVPKTNGHHK